MRKKNVIYIFILTLITLLDISDSAISQIPLTSISQPKADVENLQLRLQVFADRTVSEKNEDINIWVLVDSELTDSATVFVFVPKEKLILKGPNSQSVPLPMKQPIAFTVVGKDVGKFNLLLYASGINKVTKQQLISNQQIQGIDIQSSTQWWSNSIITPLFGVLFGALLTLATTLINDYRQRRREKSQREQWLFANLPAQLKVDRIAVTQEKGVDVEVWANKFLTEGYYAELQDLLRRANYQEDLGYKLLEIRSSLIDYEQTRLNNRLTKDKKEEISTALTEIIKLLESLQKS